jgi:hypothetical protein
MIKQGHSASGVMGLALAALCLAAALWLFTAGGAYGVSGVFLGGEAVFGSGAE